MATKKRAPAKSGKRGSGAKKRGSRGNEGGFFASLRGIFEGGPPRELFGVLLLAAGLFFTAAFASGAGAFLGEAGRFAVTRLFGVAGFALAPISMVVGVLLLMGALPIRRVLGAALVFLAFAATFAARLPERGRFASELYSEAGGVVGSGIYGAVHLVAGVIGAVIVVGLLYAVGLSLLTGVTFKAVFESAQSGFESLKGRLGERKKDRRGASREKSSQPRGVEDLYAELEDGLVVSGKEKRADPVCEDEFEVVLPKQREGGLPREREVVSGEYTPPPFSLLGRGSGSPGHDAEETSRRLTQALADLGVEATVARAVVGPRVTRYELRLGSGVKVGKVSNLRQDIAYALAATEVRILAPIPGKSAVGVEVPNTRPAKVTLGDIFEDYPEAEDWALPVGLGKDISGRAVFMNLAEMPHLLVAGTTGSGKSVMLNALLTSLLLTTDPRRVKMVLIDPKRVEMTPFARIPHLITPVVTDVKKAANALGWAVSEMERRYEVLEKMGVRSLDGYNERAETPMPYVVIVIDELADLMMTAASKVEDAVIRIAQKARAVGIHLVVATQRPSVDVITGMIKANVPSRIAFAVSSQVDSRVILDSPGAEALLGMGDMLFKPVSASRPSRIQGAFIGEGEVEKVVAATVEASKGNVRAEFIEEVVEPKNEKEETGEPDDELLPEAASFVVSTQQASVSAVQRRFRVGYSRAGRIIDALERKGVVGPYEGSKSRSVVATDIDLASIFDWNGGEEARIDESEVGEDEPRGGW
ncbi:MAG: DNA translocase FtsK 4TM domain-containing protein [Rubrobacteraceae bacterium]